MSSKNPWMPLYINDYLDDTADLTFDESACYLFLLMIAWRRDGSIPSDITFLKRALSRCAVGMHGHSFNRMINKVLKRFFTLDNEGNWRNHRLDEELQKSYKRSANAKYMNRKRWGVSSKINTLGDHQGLLSHHIIYNKNGKGKKKMSELDEKLKVSTDKFYAAFASAQLDAWNEYERAVKKTTPRDADGGWWFPAEWPPTIN